MIIIRIGLIVSPKYDSDAAQFVVRVKIQQSNIKSKKLLSDTEWELQCDASVLWVKDCELSKELNKAKDVSS